MVRIHNLEGNACIHICRWAWSWQPASCISEPLDLGLKVAHCTILLTPCRCLTKGPGVPDPFSCGCCHISASYVSSFSPSCKQTEPSGTG